MEELRELAEIDKIADVEHALLNKLEPSKGAVFRKDKTHNRVNLKRFKSS